MIEGLCLFRFDSLQKDLEVLFFTLLILVYAIAYYVRFYESKDFKKGRNLIFKNRCKTKLGITNVMPISFELEIPYTPSIGWFSVLFVCGVAALMIYADYYFQIYGLHMLFVVGVGLILIMIYHYFRQRHCKREYRNGVFKIGAYGLWTNKLGAVSWGEVSEINLYYVTRLDKYSTDDSHLEIVVFGNRRDQFKIREIVRDKKETKKLIEEYSEKWLIATGQKDNEQLGFVSQ